MSSDQVERTWSDLLIHAGAPPLGEWVAIVSGLDIGLAMSSAADNDSLDASIQLLVEFLLGEAGGVEVGSASG